ncbi:MAG: hypothetical protein ACKVOY_17400 [Burkholderiaceae bacterium]
MKIIQSIFVLFTMVYGISVYSADTYSGTTLTIPVVKVGSNYYPNVQFNVTLADVVAVGAKDASPLSYDNFDTSTMRLTAPEVLVGTTPYYNVVIQYRDGMLLSMGTACASLQACLSTSASTSTPTSNTATSVSALYYGPSNYGISIQASYTPGTMTAATGFTNRNRLLISNSATQSSNASYMQIGSTYSATEGYSVETGTLTSNSTYNTYLQKTIQVVQYPTQDDFFRLDPHLHPNNSMDFDATDGNKLKFRNNFGKATKLYGYVTFSYDSTGKLIQAKKRYKYSYATTTTNSTTSNAVSYTEDSAFSAANYYVSLAGGAYKLVASADQATPLYLYNTPLSLGIPDSLDPNKTAFVTNSSFPFLTKNSVEATEGTQGSIYKNVNSTYRPQVLTPGSDTTTKTIADAMLATIKSTVESNGEKLRYTPALYTAFRDAALTIKLISDAIADGTPSQNLVPYIYFTNEKDSSGIYHPFMVVVSYGNQASPNLLKDVPHPPGGVTVGCTSGYPCSQVTRFANLENYLLAIPMKDYGQVSVVTENSWPSSSAKNLWIDDNQLKGTTTVKKDVYSWADSADNGILIDGSVMFPTYNNTLVPSNVMGELTASGCHVGQGGGGPHCHFDGYQSGHSLGVYGDADYVGKTHPPIIGFGYDGIALFGKYRSADTAMLGYGTALDEFGGHNHDGIGYHYHAHRVSNHKADYLTYPVNMDVLIKGAYIGKSNDIPFFREKSSTFSTNKYLGGTVR